MQSKIRGTFDMRESWVQELKDKDQIQVEHVPGAHNCADLMSKTHRTCRFQQLLNSITNKSASQGLSSELSMSSMLVWVP